MPDSVRLQFRERNQISVDGVALPGSIDFDEVFLELDRSVVNSRLSILHAASLLLSINLTESVQELTALTDSSWFWGTQVSCPSVYHS